MSVRSSLIGPEVSTSTLVAYAKKKHKLFSEELKNEENKLVLTSIRKDIEKVRHVITKYGKIDSDRVARIDNKLH